MFGDRSIGHDDALMKQNERKEEDGRKRKKKRADGPNVLHDIYCCCGGQRTVVYELRKLNKGLAL